MTNLPEAKLAREAELCYATVALVTDYDCWHETEECVTVEAILATLCQERCAGKRLFGGSLEIGVRQQRAANVSRALQHAIVTAPDKIPLALRRRLALLLNGSSHL